MKGKRWLVRILAAWGALALVGAIALACYWFGWFNGSKVAVVDQASTKDVSFIVGLSGLGPRRIERVLHSYTSAHSGPGGADYLNAYGIVVSPLDEADLVEAKGWHRGDALPEILDRALIFTGSWQYEVPWFPSEELLRSDEFYAHILGINTRDDEVQSLQILFVRPGTGAIYYFDTNT